MTSEAEKQAIETAVTKDLTGAKLKVNDWLSGDVEKELSADGATDVVVFVRANGWEFSREAPAEPVEQERFVRKANGLPVSIEVSLTKPHDYFKRALEREGAEELWDVIEDKKWHLGKVPQ